MSSIAISLEVDDKGSVVVKKFSDKTVSKVKQMSDKSIGHVQRLSAKFAKGLGGAVSKVGRGLMNLKTLAMGALMGWGLKNLASGFIKTGSAMDQMQISLDTITKGSGEEWFRKLNEWALKMPVNTEKAIQSFTMMRAMGLQPTIAQMTVLVDTMSALGGQADAMEGISRALGQIATKGKVSAEELMQLAERGVPVFEILKEKFGDVETSSLDARKAIAAIFEGLEERFGGQAAKIQNKWAGLVETLKSYWTDFKRMVMEAGVMVYLESGLKRIVDKIDAMKKSGALEEWAKKTAEKIIEMSKNTTIAVAKTYDTASKIIPKIAGHIERIYRGFMSMPSYIRNAGLIGAFMFGAKGAVVLAAAAKIALMVKNQAAAAGLVASGQMKLRDFATMGSAELDEYIKKFDKKFSSRGPSISLTGGISTGGMSEKVKAFWQEFEDAQESTVQKNIEANTAIVSNTINTAQQQIQAVEQSAEERIKAMLKVAESDKSLLAGRLSEYEKFYSSLQSKIAAAANMEKKHIRELNALYRQKADIQKSAAEMIRGLREAEMAPMERYKSQESALNQQYFKAMRMSGQEQVKALEEYKRAVASFAGGFRGGVMETTTRFGVESTRTIVESGKIVEDAISNIERATSAQQRALEGLAFEKDRQISADRAWGDALASTAQDVAGEIEYLQDTIGGLSSQIENMQKVIDLKGIDNVTPVIDQIRHNLDALHDYARKPIIITTIHRTTYEPGGGGTPAPVEGSYQHGTNYVPKTGLYELHRGEKVTPAHKAGNQTFGDIVISIPESAAPQRPEDWREITRTYIKPELERLG